MTIDVQAFMAASHTETIGTARVPVPTGDYTGQIDTDPSKMALEQGSAGPNAKNPGAPWARLDVLINIPDPSGSIAAATGRSPVIVRYGIMLDLDASGMPVFTAGKNINLGRLFKAIGHPVDSKGNIQSPWSFTELPGKPLKITIAHDPNPNDPANPYERVSAVTSA
jgi:hypothetical protein